MLSNGVIFFLTAGLFSFCARATNIPDITLPVGSTGTILIRPHFIDYPHGFASPVLTLQIKNQTLYPWRTIALRFDIGALCRGEVHQWSIPVATSLDWAGDHGVVKRYSDDVVSLMNSFNFDGCSVEIIRATLVSAEARLHESSPPLVVRGDGEATVDLKPQLQEIKAARDAERDDAAAQRAEQERKAAEAELQQKKAAVSAGSAEHRFLEAKRESVGLLSLDALRAEANCRKVDTYDACHERIKPIMDEIEAQEALVSAQLAKVDECKKTYRTTIDKKTSDLTVRESTAVKTCQALDLYPYKMPTEPQRQP